MTPESLHDMFLASAGVAGALIGLLFVAISVEHDRLVAEDADQVHRVRASAALSAFTSALTISLFALTPGEGLANSTTVVGSLGILFVIGGILSVRRKAGSGRTRTGRLRDLVFLVGQFLVFVFLVVNGVRLLIHPHSTAPADDIATLVIICFLLAISRSWELIGGPEVGVGREMRAYVREHHAADPVRDAEPDGGR